MISQPFKGYTEAVRDQTRPCYVNAANFLNYARIQLCTLIGTHHLHTHLLHFTHWVTIIAQINTLKRHICYSMARP